VESGTLLRFDGIEQRLRAIEVYNVNLVGTLLYKNNVFGSAEEKPTFHKIYERFGPSTPGTYNEEKGSYLLRYRGVAFLFPIPPQFAKFYRGTDDDRHALPLEFPGGLSPVVSRIYVYCGSDHRTPLLPPLPSDSHYFELVEVHIGKGVKLMRRNKHLSFRSSVQDALTDLGEPDRVFFKEEDEMQSAFFGGAAGFDDDFASASLDGGGDYSSLGGGGSLGGGHVSMMAAASARMGYSDFFFNYFELGIDLLFDKNTHTIKKFVLHTNFPSHCDFNRYRKCNFVIADLAPRQRNGAAASSSSADTATSPTSDFLRGDAKGKGKTRHNPLIDFEDPGPIGPDSHWDDIKRCFAKAPGAPVVDNRGLNVNPFGSSLFYAYENIIFEVMSNGHIASLLLFKSK
jgi:phagosome assembly factor 1